MNLKASYFTLGCKLNYAETSTVARLLERKGIERAGAGDVPDLCVVNTCSVTDVADKKGRSLIRRLHTRYPDAAIIVTGCYAQLDPDTLAAMEGVDMVLGTDEKLRLDQFLDRWLEHRRPVVEVTPRREISRFHGSCDRGDRTRWWLKVQDGCDYFCTYCTIPMARGRSRSASIGELAAMAEDAAAQGAREIVLTGVNTGCFGEERGETLLQLMRRLDAIEGIERYRISSIEPNLITEEMIDWVATESRAFMPHFHIPLQAGSDFVLQKMNRRYDTALFADRIAYIRQQMPDAYIGVDVIAGARGETAELWQESMAFIGGLDVTRLHVFPYSERPGTAALLMHLYAPDRGERHRRVGELTALSAEKWRRFAEGMLGSERPVLWERCRGGRMHGLTDNYLRVSAPAHPELINTITRARLDAIQADEPETIIASL